MPDNNFVAIATAHLTYCDCRAACVCTYTRSHAHITMQTTACSMLPVVA